MLLLLLLLLLRQEWCGQVNAAACAGLPASGRLPCLADLPACGAGETATQSRPKLSVLSVLYHYQQQSHQFVPAACGMTSFSSTVLCCVHTYTSTQEVEASDTTTAVEAVLAADVKATQLQR
jgi:hypothetical protein